MQEARVIRARRKLSGLSQNQVSARAKVNRSSYSLFENGHGELRKEHIPIIRRLIERALLQRAKELRRFNVVRGQA
jgi:transcriptional regulator with XRE-family HTH domain